MSSSSTNVLDVCKQLLDNYNPSLSPAHYIQDLAIMKDPSYFDYEKSLVCEVFYGCCDKAKTLDIVVDGFYAKDDGKICLKSEKNYFKILTFICLYRLEEYGLEELKYITTLWNQEKTLKFLLFLSDDKNLLTWIKSAWSGLYNPDYVNDKLIGSFKQFVPELREFLKTLELKVYTVGTKKTKAPTQPEPFSFQTSKIVHKVLAPEKIAAPVRREVRMLNSAEKAQRIKKAEDMQKSVAPKYKIRTKPIARAECEEEDSDEGFKVPVFKANPFKLTQNTASVKLNTAVVLREEHVIKKQTENILKKFEYLENGDRNEDEFLAWQQEMKLNDLRAEVEESEKKKLQSKISYENAKLAKENEAQANKTIAKEVQGQKDLLNRQRLERKAQEDAANRQNAIAIKEYERYVASTVKEEVINSKKAIAQEVAKESEELQLRAYREAEVEMAKRMELIQQIKAAESISVDRTKPVDLTSTAGHRLLNEMSIAELYERLELCRQQAEEEKMRMHDSIIRGKMEKDQYIVEKLHYINKFRNENAILEKKVKTVSASELREAIRKDLVAKNSSIQGLRSKLSETKADAKLISKGLAKKVGGATTYAEQRRIMEWERMKDLEKKMERNANIV